MREYLTEVEDLRREHKRIYEQMLKCNGLEKCLGNLYGMSLGEKYDVVVVVVVTIVACSDDSVIPT